MRDSIRFKTPLLLTVFAVVPLLLAGALLLPSYGQSVRQSEERYELIVVSEVASVVDGFLGGALSDAQTIAGAVEQASMLKPEHAALSEPLIRAALATRANIDVVRLEIPSAQVDTVLGKEGAALDSAPSSTAALRERAKSEGFAFDVLDERRGILVVAVASQHDRDGYISIPIFLSPVQAALDKIAKSRELDPQTAHIVVADAERRLVAGWNFPRKAGSSLRGFALWASLESMAFGGAAIGVKAEPVMEGETMVAAIQTLKTAGWVVALWQPRDVALQEFTRIQRAVVTIAGVVFLLALLAGMFVARRLTRPVLSLVHETRAISSRAWSRLSPPLRRKDEIGDLSRSVSQMAGELQQSELELKRELKLRGDLARFMSQEIVEGIIEERHPLELGGRREEVTVMFADMVAFTKAAEVMPPEQVVKMLNELFSILTEVVFRHDGIVDKFIGDCVMAVWGAPLSDPKHARNAMEAAEDIMAFLEVGADNWRQRYGVEVRLGLGVNSGTAIVGNIGSDKRMDYTVIGDVVNIAARLEAIAEPNQVLVGEGTQALLGDAFELRLLGSRQLTGRTQSTRVYELQL